MNHVAINLHVSHVWSCQFCYLNDLCSVCVTASHHLLELSDLSQHYMCATQNNSPFTASWLVFHSFPTCAHLFNLHWLLLLIQVPCGPVFQGYKGLEFSICLKLLVWCYRILRHRAFYSAWKFKSFSSTALNKTASRDICVCRSLHLCCRVQNSYTLSKKAD